MVIINYDLVSLHHHDVTHLISHTRCFQFLTCNVKNWEGPRDEAIHCKKERLFQPDWVTSVIYYGICPLTVIVDTFHIWLLSFHESSVGLSSTTNPKPRGKPSQCLLSTPRYHQQKAEPPRCLALRTRGGRLKSTFVPWELSLPT